MPLASIEQLLKERMGLHSATVGSSTVSQAVDRRMRACDINTLAAYARILHHSDTELNALIDAVIIPETWFFRDRNPFDAFTQWVKNDWLTHHSMQPLRILSVPCSSGEEPYTLAMCLSDAGVAATAAKIDAVDICNGNIEKARQADYGANSFRGSDLAFRDRHFIASEHRYQLNDDIRSRVNFSKANILDAEFTHNRPAYQVIFCRNLLIYFDRPTQDRAVDCLEGMLDKYGLLFLGHSETSLLLKRSFTPLAYSRSFGFRRNIKKSASEVAAAPRRRTSLPARHQMVQPVSHQPEPFADIQTENATPTEPAAISGSSSLDLLATATQLADQGQLDKAAQHCETLLAKQTHQAEAYYLLGIIRQATGKLKEAEQLYNKTIYLQPNHYQALIQLAGLCQKKGDTTGAQRLSQRAARAQERSQAEESDA